ncbi:glucose-6-phosphate dehydrogenase assembly protein OpcA [Aeromicrobium massiliense]|uniref:glucose-6-phosphate dehydrogenase assembly protein OpcA n=1 Tax=Aeromicrobium massiliense TaxID=1464554 RepID=UPI0002D4ED4D|nr:glucose-6-phosphate dehydrogenase assembly protein OpcA [Aeromicrobium massiliense]
MQIELNDTNASEIARAMVKARMASGSPAMDMVLTFVVITDEDGVADALRDATDLAKEHPARVIGVIRGSGRGAATLHAKVRVGQETSGESVLLRMSGQLVKHAESVVLPLLLPDSPVVVWWPGEAPADPAEDPIGRLAQRRLTDSEASSKPVHALRAVARRYEPGDTDLAWTRLTPMRGLLAAALDQTRSKVRSAELVAGPGNPAAVLLAAWLEDRLRIDVSLTEGSYPHVSQVKLHTDAGDVLITREADTTTFSVPGASERQVPLVTRTVPELLAEDLRRLDADDVYESTVKHMLEKGTR